jgi:catechol 2,3-dioxygenase-like lactoylglutathione lyase family enzyme
MISSIRHIGFVVRDIEESLKFYSGVLELDVYSRFTEKGRFIDNLTGIKDVTLEWVKLIIPNGGLIELLQYHSHPDSSNQITNFPSNRLGCSHVALTSSNLDLLYRQLQRAGYFCKSKPLTTVNGKAKILYCHDPDGAIVELIEDLK